MTAALHAAFAPKYALKAVFFLLEIKFCKKKVKYFLSMIWITARDAGFAQKSVRLSV